MPLHTALAEGALAAPERDDTAAHNEAAARAAMGLIAQQGCAAIVLAQFSLARAALQGAAACGVAVLTTVDSAVRRLRSLLG